ncbi:MAG: DUF116 domain-containing protein [Elusimicrobia bacterium]|nr:DUF116 domain-containing protein [Elusimicrobiota bacterium]
MWLIYNIFFPLVLLAGKILRVSPDQTEAYLINLNNRLRRGKKGKVEKILILTPSCLQNKDCKNNIVEDAQNCRKCGTCKIKDLLELSEKYAVKLAVATGGRLARQVLEDTQADTVIAVACEKELANGIIDTYPVAVHAVVNQRPFGPCVNTDLRVQDVESIMRRICQSH